MSTPALTVPDLFSDHAVLPADRPCEIWGQAPANAPVEVTLATASVSTRADHRGHWSVTLPPLPVGGPHRLAIQSEDALFTAEDIWLGEVWLGSGQSNMEWTLGQLEEDKSPFVLEGDSRVRIFTVGRRRAIPGHGPEAAGQWVVAEGSGQAAMSGAAYHFARRIAASIDRPVGVIVSAWGGSGIASWLAPEDITNVPGWEEEAVRVPTHIPESSPITFHKDPGRAPETAGWELPENGDSDWQPFPVPAMWQVHGWDFNGAVWYRREVNIPDSWAGKPLRLKLGKVDDFDDTFFNGHRVGGLDIREPNAFDMIRRYDVPASLVAPGRAVITVRVFDHFGQGGLPGPAALMRIFPADEPDAAIPLAGDWKARVELRLPLNATAEYAEPTSLYSGMIAPLRAFGLRGVLWYQGESDVCRAAIYSDALISLIAAWRRQWRQPELPVAIVQLPRYQPATPEGGLNQWPLLRAAQARVAESTGAGLVPMIDTGDPFDIHPRNKAFVGERLSRWALSEVYGSPSPWRARHPVAVQCSPEEITLTFPAGSGLRTRDEEPPRGIVWRSADSATVPANITLTADAITIMPPPPVGAELLHAWEDAPDSNLTDAQGLPLAPFALVVT